MFLKLLKHDFKNSFKDYALLFIIMIVFALIAPLLINSDIEILNILVAIMISFLVVGSFVMVIVNTVSFIKRRMFSDAAYLNLTLPVSMSSTLLSKIIVSVTWIMVTIILSLVSVGIFGFIMYSIEPVDLSFLWDQLRHLRINFPLLFELLLLYIVELANAILVLILSFSIANSSFFKKNSNIFIFLIFFLISMLLGFVDNVFMSIFSFDVLSVTADFSIFVTSDAYLIVGATIAYKIILFIILMLITNYLMNQKLEI